MFESDRSLATMYSLYPEIQQVIHEKCSYKSCEYIETNVEALVMINEIILLLLKKDVTDTQKFFLDSARAIIYDQLAKLGLDAQSQIGKTIEPTT